MGGHAVDAMVRLNKLLVSKIGGMSRREADQLILQNRVRVNGAIVTTLGSKFDPDDCIIDVVPLDNEQQKTTVILNKPLGVVSCQPDQRFHLPAIQLLIHQNRCRRSSAADRTRVEPARLPKMAVAGRLDINSTGLLLFTQCGKTASDIIGPRSTVEKEYLVRYRAEPSRAAHVHDDAESVDIANDLISERIDRLRQGIDCSGERLDAVSVHVLNADQLRIVLQSGKKHHIRRMLNAVGWNVQALKRVRIGSITLGSLPKCQWRYLQPHERVL